MGGWLNGTLILRRSLRKLMDFRLRGYDRKCMYTVAPSPPNERITSSNSYHYFIFLVHISEQLVVFYTIFKEITDPNFFRNPLSIGGQRYSLKSVKRLGFRVFKTLIVKFCLEFWFRCSVLIPVSGVGGL